MLPRLVAHADWGSNPRKRWIACALRQAEASYLAFAPRPVGETGVLLDRLRQEAGLQACILVGFDFPIGLPLAYAAQTGITDFPKILPELGRGIWSDFYRVAESPEQIHLRRPFYPNHTGHARQEHLWRALGAGGMDDLRRECERPHPGRGAAAPLFWTLGGQQVGKAAIHGWRDVLGPALRRPDSALFLWPFDGPFFELIHPGRTVVAETYPAEVYRSLHVNLRQAARQSPPQGDAQVGPRRGKRSAACRRANTEALISWADRAGVILAPELRQAILDGFGPSQAGEDPFDATVGLFGMLEVVLGRRLPGDPEEASIRKVEGWILGQAAET